VLPAEGVSYTKQGLRRGFKSCPLASVDNLSTVLKLGRDVVRIAVALRFGSSSRLDVSQLNDIVWSALHRAQAPRRYHNDSLYAGSILAWDVTSLDTLAPSNVTDSAQKAGSAAAKVETLKIAK
jgi:hypothetical protein